MTLPTVASPADVARAAGFSAAETPQAMAVVRALHGLGLTGTASDLATFAGSGKQSPDPQAVDTQITALQHRFGTVQVIENQTFHVPGSTQTYQLRSQDPNGPYGGPMLQLLSGRYPTAPDEVALTSGLASDARPCPESR